MPLFQVGYRGYVGQRTLPSMRWLPITSTGLTIAWRSKLLKRLVLASFLPFLYFGWVFFLIGRVTQGDALAEPTPIDILVASNFGPEFLLQLQQDPTQIRTAVWSIVFARFSVNIQLLIGGLVAAIVGPPLISSDIRSKAFLIYFSRPISRFDYLLGKLGTVASMMAVVTLLPALVLYAISIVFSPSLDTLSHTAPVLLSVVLASLVAIIPASLVVLTISSLTKQPRFATAAWIVLMCFGPLAHSVLQQTNGLRDSGWTFLLSLPHSVLELQLGLYNVAGRVEATGIQTDLNGMIGSLSTDHSPWRAAIWLACVCSFCFFTLMRRVDSPTRI
ncbi:MAG: ABC-2 type transport system permease protein [Planctomycetota bacterium]